MGLCSRRIKYEVNVKHISKVIKAGLYSMVTMAFISASPASKAVTVPEIFSNGTVLQRDVPVPVWGWAQSGEEVTVDFAGQILKAKADPEGRWTANLAPMPASKEPRTMKISGSIGNQKSEIGNILVGEVWLWAGQCETVMRHLPNTKNETDAANFPFIRYFRVMNKNSTLPLDEIKGSWILCDPRTATDFQVIPYHFAKRISKELDVPVGIIGTTWHHTRIDPWISPDGFRTVPELSEEIKFVNSLDPSSDEGKAKYQKWINEVKTWLSSAETSLQNKKAVRDFPEYPGQKNDFQMPSQIFNGMISPLASYALRGVIWDQGETNSGAPSIYFNKLKALINGWRAILKNDKLPFYIVQLPTYAYIDGKTDTSPAGSTGWAYLREVQMKAAAEIPAAMSAVTIDLGNSASMLPGSALRLADFALSNIYGGKIPCGTPTYKSHTIEENKIRIAFDKLLTKLTAGTMGPQGAFKETPGVKVKWFTVAGKDKVWQWADAVVDGKTVLVSSDKVPAPVAVRYAFTNSPEGPFLYTAEGQPVPPFRTDDW